MQSFIAGCLCLALLVVSEGIFAKNIKQPSVFFSKEKAVSFARKQKNAGNKTSLITQKQNYKRYIVYLKGYPQWSLAFKQAQLLEKSGYNNIEVVKDSFKRSYSIIVSQALSKEKAGKVFNNLRKSGLKNIRVKTDIVKLTRYIVAVHPPGKPANPVVTTSQSLPEISKIKAVKQKTLYPQSDNIIINEQPDLSEDSIIVMSGDNDDAFDIAYDEELENSNIDWAVDKIILEEELFSRSSSAVDIADYGHISSHVNWRISENWDMQLAARVDAYKQHGNNSSDINDLDLDYENNYIRYRNEDLRLTAGTQTIRWGRMDVLSPTDNMVTMDWSRGVLPKWDDLYRASPALRGELFLENSKLDLIYLPKFREAELPNDKENVWYPINFRKGEILGGKISPLSKTILKNATIDDKVGGDGGLGLRFSSNINAIDYALTVQRVRLSAPAYKINESFRRALLSNPLLAIANQTSFGYTYTEEHPRNWVVGGDMAFQWQDYTLRFEGAWFSDLPATTRTLEYKTYKGFRWASGVEFYPGDADTRVILQLAGSHIDEKQKIVDRDNSLTLTGETETLFSNSRWRLSTKFNIGLDIKDIYISPEISFLGWEPFEIYTAAHYFDGSEQSMGGFYRENSMITFGWRGRY